jgi:hypothetical protein
MVPGMDLMIPVKRNAPFDDPAYLFDLKLDGYRRVADTIAGRMLSKNGNRLAPSTWSWACPRRALCWPPATSP